MTKNVSYNVIQFEKTDRTCYHRFDRLKESKDWASLYNLFETPLKDILRMCTTMIDVFSFI